MNHKDCTKFTVHMIANAHIDPAWLWDWREGREEVFNTCRSALMLMDEFPELTFTRGGAATYKWIEDADPEMFDQIRRHVNEGRWELVNGWWVQPDCNIPNGESYIRHSLYGKRYFQEKFDVDVKIGYNVDTFGHCSVLPQVLRRAGFEYYVFFRPAPHEKELPSRVFHWESADGSRVLALRAPHHYNTAPEEDMTKRIIKACELSGDRYSNVACFYGIGNHGGGPTRNHIKQIRNVQEMDGMPRVKFSTLGQFFAALQEESSDFPVVKEDLQHHAVGCYSAVSEVKLHNRRTESLLMASELYSTAAQTCCGGSDYQENFERGWKKVLFNQFHDILAGSSIKPVYDDANVDYAAATRDADVALDHALEKIAQHVDTTGPGRPLLLFNPLPWDRTDVVVTDFLLSDYSTTFKLLNSRGEPLPIQIIDQVDQAGHCRTTVCFKAEMPASGCTVLHLVEDDTHENAGNLRAHDGTLESSRFKLKIGDDTGHVVSLYDKINGLECFSAPACVPVVLNDPSDTWSHSVDSFRDEIAQFTGSARVIECGPVRAVIRSIQFYNESTIQHDFIVYNEIPRIDCEMLVDWHEEHKALKLAFPINVGDPNATFEVPLGTMNRPSTGNEEPGQRWVDVTGIGPSGKRFGVTLVNDSKYGYDVKTNELRMTVLRSPIYAFHDPREVEPFKRYIYTDQGPQMVKYSLLPHRGSWRDAGAMQLGYAKNTPLFIKEVKPHEGRLSNRVSFMRTSPANVIAEVLKKAEDGNGMILRLYEAYGRDAEATFELPVLGVKHAFAIRKNEIKTFRIEIPEQGAATVTETNLLEE